MNSSSGHYQVGPYIAIACIAHAHAVLYSIQGHVLIPIFALHMFAHTSIILTGRQVWRYDTGGSHKWRFSQSRYTEQYPGSCVQRNGILWAGYQSEWYGRQHWLLHHLGRDPPRHLQMGSFNYDIVHVPIHATVTVACVSLSVPALLPFYIELLSFPTLPYIIWRAWNQSANHWFTPLELESILKCVSGQEEGSMFLTRVYPTFKSIFVDLFPHLTVLGPSYLHIPLTGRWSIWSLTLTLWLATQTSPPVPPAPLPHFIATATNTKSATSWAWRTSLTLHSTTTW